MVKEVDLLSYWMPVLRQLKEFKEIAKAEEPEIRALLEACNSTLNNFFIPTADEQGISRFERMLGIPTDTEADLETRRLSVLTKWASQEVYTDNWLYNKLTAFCGGEDKFKIIPHYEEYDMEIEAELGVKGAIDILASLLEDVLPCNLTFSLKHYLKSSPVTTLHTGAVVSTAMRYQLTDGVNHKVSTVAVLNPVVITSVANAITVNFDSSGFVNTALLGKAVVGTMVLGTM